MRLELDTPYARWCVWLERFAAGADEPLEGLPAMDPGELGGLTAARFAERCGDALQLRLTRWHEQLGRDLDRTLTPLDVREALQAARRRLTQARALTASVLLFPELREALSDALEASLKQAQEALEESAFAHRDDGEQLLRAVREVRVDRALEHGPGAAPTSQSTGARTGRSVLLR